MKLYYYDSENFGDAMSPRLVSRMSGCEISLAPFETADLSAVGSIFFDGNRLFKYRDMNRGIVKHIQLCRRFLKTRRTPLIVWGSGFLRDASRGATRGYRKLDVRALRGGLTRDILLKVGLLDKDRKVVLGDPGLLYSMLVRSNIERRYDIGVVPHYMDKCAGKYVFKTLSGVGLRAIFIDVMNRDPLETVSKIASCNTIISSSLHGCIVADSLGIPNRQMVLSFWGNSETDFYFKYRDYYSSLNMKMPRPYFLDDICIDSVSVCSRIRADYRVSIDFIATKKRELIESFPYEKIDSSRACVL